MAAMVSKTRCALRRRNEFRPRKLQSDDACVALPISLLKNNARGEQDQSSMYFCGGAESGANKIGGDTKVFGPSPARRLGAVRCVAQSAKFVLLSL